MKRTILIILMLLFAAVLPVRTYGAEQHTFSCAAGEQLSSAEAMTILEIVLGDPETLPDDWSWWKTQKGEKGYDNYGKYIGFASDCTEKGTTYDYACSLCWNFVKEHASGLQAYDLFQENGFSFEGERLSFIGKADFVELVYWLSEHKDEINKSLDIYQNISYPEWFTAEAKIHFEEFLGTIPQFLVREVRDRIHIIDSDVPYAGYYYFTGGRIDLRCDYAFSASTLIHEIGHAMYYEKGIQRSACRFYAAEDLTSVCGRDYNLTSPSEYFAEGFSAYFLWPDAMKRHAPLLYEYIDSFVRRLAEQDN